MSINNNIIKDEYIDGVASLREDILILIIDLEKTVG